MSPTSLSRLAILSAVLASGCAAEAAAAGEQEQVGSDETLVSPIPSPSVATTGVQPMKLTCRLADVGSQSVPGALLGNPNASVVVRYAAGCRATLALRTDGITDVIDAEPKHLLGLDGAVIEGHPVVCATFATTGDARDVSEGGEAFQIFDVSAAKLSCYSRRGPGRPWQRASLPVMPEAQWLTSLDTAGTMTWLRDTKVHVEDLLQTGRPDSDGAWRTRVTVGSDGMPRFVELVQTGAMPFGNGDWNVAQTLLLAQIGIRSVPFSDDLASDVVRAGDYADAADGIPDRSFTVFLRGEVRSLTLVAADGTAHWDTIHGADPTPLFATRRYTRGSQTWGMRIRDVDTGAWVSLPLPAGEHTLEVFVADPSALVSTSPSPSPSVSAAPTAPTGPTLVPSALFGTGKKFFVIAEQSGAAALSTGEVAL